MITKAVRLYGKNDIRLEEFSLPEPGEDEILAHVISDSICMSTYKTVISGAEHKRVHEDVAQNPIIIGHEFCAEVLYVGKKHKNDFEVGDRVVISPLIEIDGKTEAIGYAFRYTGGSATDIIIPDAMISGGYVIKHKGASFLGSLAEPVSCIISGFKSCFHTAPDGYSHINGIKKGGNLAILAGCGPMGLGAADYAVNKDDPPSLIVVTDINKERVERAKAVLTPEYAARRGVRLVYSMSSDRDELLSLTEGRGFDDVFVYAPVPQVITLADSVLANDGCLNFFAGPTDKNLCAGINFYNIHYAAHHIMGTSGSDISDMKEALRLMGEGKINPAPMITHIGGLCAVSDTVKNLPKIPGGKKLIYSDINLPLTEIANLRNHAATDKKYNALADIVEGKGNIWSGEAERFLLENFSAR